MQWNDEYAIGIKFIDEQHKAIFTWSEAIRVSLERGLDSSEYDAALYELTAYTQNHFLFEEQCMNKYRCPVAQANKAAHEGFITALSGFRQRYDDSGFEQDDARKLADTVDAWLDDHIRHIDIHLKKCVNK